MAVPNLILDHFYLAFSSGFIEKSFTWYLLLTFMRLIKVTNLNTVASHIYMHDTIWIEKRTMKPLHNAAPHFSTHFTKIAYDSCGFMCTRNRKLINFCGFIWSSKQTNEFLSVCYYLSVKIHAFSILQLLIFEWNKTLIISKQKIKEKNYFFVNCFKIYLKCFVIARNYKIYFRWLSSPWWNHE